MTPVDAIENLTMGSDRWSEMVDKAAQPIKERMHSSIRVGLILGTGLHHLANEFSGVQRLAYTRCPGLPSTTAIGHAGEWLIGTWLGRPVIAMNGRFHLYEGHSTSQVALPICVLHRLGVTHLIISNAAGGLNPSFRQGDVMLIEDQIDLTFRSLASMSDSQSGQNKIVDVYDQRWLVNFRKAACKRGQRFRRGVYLGLTGPTYETRAEYRCCRQLGGDVVGMSTVWEAKVAASLGMHVAGLSVVTNVATPDDAQPTSAQEVIDAATDVRKQVSGLAESLIDVADISV